MRATYIALCGLLLAALPLGAASAAPPLAVGVTIPPQAYFLEQLAGDLVQTQVLVGPGQEPHNYQPTPKQMARLSRVRLYFSLGLPLEKTLLTKLRGLNKDLVVVNTIKGITLLPMTAEHHEHGERHEGKAHDPKEAEHHHGQGEPDPHTWLSPRLVQAQAANISAALQTADPAHAQAYAGKLKAFSARLAQLDQRLAQALAPYKGRTILVFHPAFGYLAHAYGLRQVAIEQEGKEPGGKSLARLIERAQKEKVKVVFVEPQFPADNAQAVARAIGGVVAPLDPLAPDYIQNLEAMAGRIASALK